MAHIIEVGAHPTVTAIRPNATPP